MNSLIIDRVKSLPPLSKTVRDINRVFASEDSSIADLIKAIEPDPMIVANLLKSANSPLYGFGREIKTIAQAVSLFGMSVTRSIALGNSVRKLLNVDMQPYGITSDKFAEISNMQATLAHKWYKNIDKEKADKLFLAAFLQESGKIVIANYIIQEDESFSFSSEVSSSNNLAQVEKSYTQMSSSEVASEIFNHWGFDSEFIDMIKYADTPQMAPEEVQEFSIALNIIKTLVPINKPLSEMAINFGLKKAEDAGYDKEILNKVIDDMLNTDTKTADE